MSAQFWVLHKKLLVLLILTLKHALSTFTCFFFPSFFRVYRMFFTALAVMCVHCKFIWIKLNAKEIQRCAIEIVSWLVSCMERKTKAPKVFNMHDILFTCIYLSLLSHCVQSEAMWRVNLKEISSSKVNLVHMWDL